MPTLVSDAVTLSDPRIGSDGVLRSTAKFSRVGVQLYFVDGKPVRRFRPPDEVKRLADSQGMSVLTLDHPVNEHGIPIAVDASNVEQLTIGFSSQPRFENGWLQGDIAVTDKEAIEAIQRNHRYISDGYTAEMVAEPGVFVDSQGIQGEPFRSYQYDEVMRNLSHNHRAIVKNPRAGRKAVIDSSDKPMTKTITVGDKSTEVPEWLFDAFQKNAELVTDSVPAQPVLDQAAINLEVSKRQAAYEASKQFLGDDLVFDGSKSSIDWMRESLNAAGVPLTADSPIEAMFAAACHTRHQEKQSMTPSQRFAFQVDADRQVQALTSQAQQTVNDASEDVYGLLVDAQNVEFEDRENAFSLAVEAHKVR